MPKKQKIEAKADELLEKASGNGAIRVGSKVIAGTVLSHVAKGDEGIDPHINFSIRPAGKGAPRIDPKPILDGWKLLEATAIYRAKGKNPFNEKLSGAGVLLLSKEALAAAGPQRRRLSTSTSAAAKTSNRARSTAASSRCSSTCGPKASRCGSPRSSVATAT